MLCLDFRNITCEGSNHLLKLESETHSLKISRPITDQTRQSYFILNLCYYQLNLKILICLKIVQCLKLFLNDISKSVFLSLRISSDMNEKYFCNFQISNFSYFAYFGDIAIFYILWIRESTHFYIKNFYTLPLKSLLPLASVWNKTTLNTGG